jgi:hypothetical protein
MIKEFLKKIIIKSIVWAIILELKSNKNKKMIYPPSNAFGDCFEFYLKNYKKFKKKNNKFLVFSNTDLKITKFLFSRNKIKKNFFFIGNISSYEIFNSLNKSKFFKPEFNLKDKPYNHVIRKNNNFFKDLLNQKINIKKSTLSKKLENLTKSKFITFFFKHYNLNTDDLNFSSSRQTSDIKKMLKLIKFISKKFKVVILGIQTDKGYRILKNKIKKSKRIFFLNDLSKNYSIEDQLYCYSKSEGFVGNGASMVLLNWLLKKKILMFDCHYEKIDARFSSKNTIVLYKKYSLPNNRKLKILTEEKTKSLLNTKYKLVEAKFMNIKSSFIKLFY